MINHTYDHPNKRYVEVTAVFRIEPRMFGALAMMIEPLSMSWNDNEYEISRVLDIRRAASFKAGGTGLRYTVEINRKQRYIWLEEGERWFVECKSEV